MMIKGADELKPDLKTVVFSWQFHFVIIREGQIFKAHHQNSLLFEKVIPHDNGGSSNVQMTSLNIFPKTSGCDKGSSNFSVIPSKLPHFWENFSWRY